MIDYRIMPAAEYGKRVADVVSMLEHSRSVTLTEIRGLDQSRLDFLIDEASNSIGALLMHMAAIEFVHTIITFEQRDLNEDERAKWGTALELGNLAREKYRGKDLAFYMAELAAVRRNTLEKLKDADEDWLLKDHHWENGLAYNHYWMWFHVIEDEISHRGQIKLLKRLLDRQI
ncbi:DinB family protein [Bacillus infantis]|uniref:DinB family protein n=1 Tax=Bacillus infantis TaxID=324767 RepID=UPI003CF306B4